MNTIYENTVLEAKLTELLNSKLELEEMKHQTKVKEITK